MNLFEKNKDKLIGRFLSIKQKLKDEKNLNERELLGKELRDTRKIFEQLSGGESILSFISEESIRGLDIVKKANSENSKNYKSYEKDLNKKMKDSQDMDDENEGVKYEYEGEDEEIHNQYEIKNGMEMVEYDREPSEKFKKRAIDGIKGSPETGNSGFSGEAEGFKKDHDKFSDDFIKTTKASKEKRDKAKVGIVSMGDDIETTTTKSNNRKIGIAENKINVNNKTKMNKIKRLIYERPFVDKNDVISRIPEGFKEDNKTFLMTDKNETYKIRWEGSLNEGEAVILSYENKEIMNENFNKIDELIQYSPKDAIATPKVKKSDLDNTLFEMMELFKGGLLKENVESEDETTEVEEGYGSGDEDLDEAFGDMFRSYDKIFMRDNKADIDAVKSIPSGPEKIAKAKEVIAKVNAFVREKGIETGSATSLKNEVMRAMGFEVALRGGQS